MGVWFTKSWHLKIVALILAIGLWYYAVGEEGIEVKKTVSLEIQVENSQMSMLKTSASTVQVTFLAPRAQVSELASEDIRIVHVIEKDVNKAGDYSFRLERGEIKLQSPQIRVLRIEPETVQVTLDEIMVKKTEVKAQFVGEPAFGYKIQTEEIQLNPNAVLIQGPKGTLEKMAHVQTQKISLVGKTRSFRQTVSLELLPTLKLMGEPVIDLYVPVTEEADEKEFKEISVRVLRASGQGEKVELSPEKISFVVKGSKKQLGKMEPEGIFAYVDVQGLKNGDYDLPVSFFFPDNVSIKGDPIKVKVKVSR